MAKLAHTSTHENHHNLSQPVIGQASLPSATTCLERPYLLGRLGGLTYKFYCYMVYCVTVSSSSGIDIQNVQDVSSLYN